MTDDLHGPDLTAAPPSDGWRFHPAAMVRIANDVHRLGPEAAGAALVDAMQADADPGAVLLVARLLFMHRDDPLPSLPLRADDPAVPADDHAWPLLPLVLVFELPFLLAGAMWVDPALGSPGEVVRAYAEQGRLRDLPLMPETDPVHAAEVLVGSADWRRIVAAESSGRLAEVVHHQARTAQG